MTRIDETRISLGTRGKSTSGRSSSFPVGDVITRWRTDEVAQLEMRAPIGVDGDSFRIFDIQNSPRPLIVGRTDMWLSDIKRDIAKKPSCFSMRTEVMQVPLKLLGHLTSYGLMSCNHCDLF